MSTDPHQLATVLEYSEITDNIFIGTNQCCQTHFDESLLKRGLTADVSLEKERFDAPFGVSFFLWLPVVDRTAPSMDQLHTGVDFLETMVRLNKKVYVHCRLGHGRAPTLVAAYLIKQGRSPEEAVDFVHSKRPVIHLETSQTESLVVYAEAVS
ncbi:hypothetical protein COV04_04400 [Candidatus Uhrbacteria bacterium CG10_big_fil_rev_8_21_14_0_10_48_11]|uniref:Uncharacterized protein n=1 Tax=Candidatus Uhrbacteria bacterium CG10_big_fil_rev_8_21_14_0_10_48_11 TaxID=1975037 RepID=A0A2M8LDR5_9BACT|nr:MAG: hypothetical protein COV04_04400 [Candidatus Uhrbacteria bacterium CG10_big_fil_rev_8_21_14_0_10_48_11]